MPVDYSDFEKFANEMAKDFPVYAIESAIHAMEDMTDYLLGTIPEYPEESLSPLIPPDGVSFLKTDKQRAWFFAAVRNDDLKGWKWVDGHPQKIGGARTGNLGRSQGREVVGSTDYVVGIVGFDGTLAPYAPWVVGPDFPGDETSVDQYQAQVHMGRWWQFGDIIQENLDPAWAVFDQTFWEEFSSRVNGAQ